jgi:hypothetical protein
MFLPGEEGILVGRVDRMRHDHGHQVGVVVAHQHVL